MTSKRGFDKRGYFGFPRMHITGNFLSDVSTVNNNLYDYKRAKDLETLDDLFAEIKLDEEAKKVLQSITPAEARKRFQPKPPNRYKQALDRWGLYWNPKGSSVFGFRNCTIKSFSFSDREVVEPKEEKIVFSNDGKMVDLDVNQQGAPSIHGLTMIINDFVTGNVTTSTTRDMIPSLAPSGGDGNLGANFISTVDNLVWSKKLKGNYKEFFDRLPLNTKTLSIKIFTYGYIHPSRTGSVEIVIGPGVQEKQPTSFVLGTRKLWWNSQNLLVQCYLDKEKQQLFLDMTQSYFRGDPAKETVLSSFELILSKGCVERIKVGKNSQIVVVNLKDDQLKYLSNNPIKMKVKKNRFVEAEKLVLVDQFTRRTNPDEVAKFKFYLTNKGALVKKKTTIYWKSSVVPCSQFIFNYSPSGNQPKTRTLWLPGGGILDGLKGKITLTNGKAIWERPWRGPLKRCLTPLRKKCMDTNLYIILYSLNQDTGYSSSPSDQISVVDFNKYKIPVKLTWTEIRPILKPYYIMYPVMSTFLNLSNYDDVLGNVKQLIKAFNFPETHSHYMPVSRDLSKSKKNTLLKWLGNPFKESRKDVAHTDIIKREMKEKFGDNNKEILNYLLNRAIQLELTTIPIYMTALYSLKSMEENTYVNDALRTILLEEMLHMCSACNILKSIGGTTQLLSREYLPVFGPKEVLPLGCRPSVVVNVGSCSKDRILNVFMNIERPDTFFAHREDKWSNNVNDLLLTKDELRDFMLLKRERSIGDVYEVVKYFLNEYNKQSKDKKAAFGGGNQLVFNWSHPGTLLKVTDLESALFVVNQIVIQGEGSSMENIEDTSGEISHFFRFFEFYEGKSLTKDKKGNFSFSKLCIFNENNAHKLTPIGEDALKLRIKTEKSPKVLESLRAALTFLQSLNKNYYILLKTLQDLFDGIPTNIGILFNIMTDLKLDSKRLREVYKDDNGVAFCSDFSLPDNLTKK